MMTEIRQITCDAEDCGQDLTTSTNHEDWLIRLSSERIPPVGGVATMMVGVPAFSEPLHFCGWKCFEVWVRKAMGLEGP